MHSCEHTEKRSEGDPINSILLRPIGRGGVIGLVLERVVPVFARALVLVLSVLRYVVVHCSLFVRRARLSSAFERNTGSHTFVLRVPPRGRRREGMTETHTGLGFRV